MPDVAQPSAPLPLTLQDVTATWLTRALRSRWPGVTVTAVERDQILHGTASEARLQLSYDEAGRAAGLPATLYVKGGFREELRRRVWGGLAIETRFFEELAPELPLNLPACCFAEIDAQTQQAVLLLEDLGARGASYGRATEPLDADAVARVLEELARLHAALWESPRLTDYRGFRQSIRVYMKYLLRPSHWNACMDAAQGAWMPAELRDRDIVERGLERLWEISDAAPQCLVHGDAHIGNLFFEPDGRPGWLDWQCVMSSDWSHDVTYFVVGSMAIEDRRASERDLLTHYLERLAGFGAPAPEFDDAWLSYRQAAMHGLAMSSPNPLDMQPEDITVASAERVQVAAEDHDVLAALGVR